VISKGEEQTGWCFDEECKDLSRKFWVLMNEFDKLNALFYEWQVLERKEQRHREDERW